MYYINKSSIHGYGVFASTFIKKGTIISTPRYCIIPKNIIESNRAIDSAAHIFLKSYNILDIKKYANKVNFTYNKREEYCYLLFLDSISVSNTSSDKNDINVNLKYEKLPGIANFIFYAIKDINKDEEIFLDYKI